jgi:uncharacterized protein YciI
MLFVVSAFDRPGAGELRAKVRPAHLEYLNGMSEKIRAGGAFLDEDGQPVGSMLIIEAEDQRAADAFTAGDPYRLEGVFEQVDVRPWRPALGSWIG